jgi:hypothetical protein
VLVACERRGGKPRQRIVAYLGAIDEEQVNDPFARFHFWNAVAPRLGASGISRAERQKAEATLAGVAARLTAAESRHVRQELARFWPSKYGHPWPGVVPTNASPTTHS